MASARIFKFLVFLGITLCLGPGRSWADSLALESRHQNYLSLLGGGGELGSKKDTIFDGTLKAVSLFLKSHPDWKSEILFDGHHSLTDQIRDEGFPNSSIVDDFQKDSVQNVTRRYIAKINSGEIHAGDQILLAIDSHGAPGRPGESTHSVFFGNTYTLSGAIEPDEGNLIDLDPLKELSRLAQEKGVKLAIVDGSCHSGFSMALANKNTCVIAATGKDQFSYNTFSSDFFERAAKDSQNSKSLEELFLPTRSQEGNPSFPMISTQAGNRAQELLYGWVGSKLLYVSQETGPSSSRLLDSLTPALIDRTLVCDKEDSSEIGSQGERLIQDFQPITEILTPEIERLNQAIREYQLAQQTIEASIKKLNLVDQKLKNSNPEGYKVSELLTIDFEARIAQLNGKLSNEPDVKQQSADRALLEKLQSESRRRDQIVTQHPELLKLNQAYREIALKTADTLRLATQVAQAERKVYAAIYPELRDNSPEQEVCKDFKL